MCVLHMYIYDAWSANMHWVYVRINSWTILIIRETEIKQMIIAQVVTLEQKMLRGACIRMVCWVR